ncbi:MAG: DNA pilot protein [Microvirus sp.]|nr:MAG: DNA pilot protein [Microvirus sp.]
MPAWIAGGAAIVGDLFGMHGQESANAAAAAESQKNRDFQANQSLINRQWEEEMSDTAMQRRVLDLTKAGINPLMAVSQGGASQPSISTPGGSQASFGNPGASFGALGGQVSNAIGVEQQNDLIKAQTSLLDQQRKKTKSETPSSADFDENGVTIGGENHTLGDLTAAQIQAQTGATTAQAQQIATNVNLIREQLKNADADTALKNVQELLADQNLEVLKATKQALVQQQLARGSAAENEKAVQQGTWGRVVAYINSALHPLSSAAGAAAPYVR